MKFPAGEVEYGVEGVLGVEMERPWHFGHRPCSSDGDVLVQVL